MVGKKRVTRRGALGLIAGGAAATVADTGAFSSLNGTRAATLGVVSDSDGYVGLQINSEVQKNNQELLADVTNNTGENLSVTFSLDDCTQGTLYGPDGGSGCSVTFPVSNGSTRSVDIEAAVTGTITFTITAESADFWFQANRSTDAVSGNTSGAVEITTLKQFSANATADEWTIKDVKAESNLASASLDRAEYEVKDSNGNVVGTLTENATGDVYERKGSANNPAITIQPDDASYNVQPGETYQLSLTVYDDAGNYDVETRTDTA